MSREAYLDEASNTLRFMVYQTAMGLHSLSAALYYPHEPPKSGVSLMSWCLVDSSSQAGLSFAQLQSVGGVHLRGYRAHQDLYSVTMSLLFGFALAGQLVQIPAAAHSIPKISELLLLDLQLYNLGLSRPLWVWLWIQRDFVNPGIWAAFLCINHCPSRHTCGIYPHYPQKTSLATTSNDELGQEEDQIALPCVEEVHWAVHFSFSLLEGASLLIRRLGQVRDTLQIPSQALAKMSLWAIGKSEIPPRYQVAIHHAIF